MTVIIPIYNVEKYIKNCLDSIINIKESSEILIIDDGSTDGSEQICDDYARKDNRIRVIHKTHEGLVAARKTGVQNACGEYITFIDADDVVDENYVSNMMQYVDKYDCELVVAAFYRQFGDKIEKSINGVSEGLYCGDELKEQLIPNMLSTGSYYHTGIKSSAVAKIFKKSLLLETQKDIPNEIQNGEDVALLYPYVLKTKSVYISNEAHYYYRQYPESMSQKTELSQGTKSNELLYKYLKQKFLLYPFENNLISQLNEFMSHMILRISPEKYDTFPGEIKCFGGLKANSGVVIYGAGRFGKKMYEYMCKYFKEVLWVDRQSELYSRQGLPVKSVDCLYDFPLKCDYILISLIDENVVTKIKQEMTGKGINSDMIKTIDIKYVTRCDVVEDILQEEESYVKSV